MQKVDGIEKLMSDHDPYLDCYVSTDSPELDMLLLENFNYTEKEMPYDPIFGIMGLMNPSTGLELRTIDIGLDEKLKKFLSI